MAPICSVSIDLDPITCYARIHALDLQPNDACAQVVRRWVPRFAEIFARRGIHATFFVVGSSLEVPGTADAIAALAGAGHELGNHSEQHLYALARQPRGVIADEIERTHERLAQIAGHAPVGFRAPGYDVSARVLDELMRLGYRYDSSVFPAPPYYAAKAAVMGLMRLVGRRSGAVLTNPLALLAPPEPYRPDARAPWRRGQAPIVELPIAVTPWARTPAIGTTLLLAPAWLRRRWLRAMRGRSWFNLELHGIDLADAVTDAIPPQLVARQPDLRVAGAVKRAALEDLLDELAVDYRFTPLREVASLVHRDGGLSPSSA